MASPAETGARVPSIVERRNPTAIGTILFISFPPFYRQSPTRIKGAQ
jgi:hypothetical protein